MPAGTVPVRLSRIPWIRRNSSLNAKRAAHKTPRFPNNETGSFLSSEGSSRLITCIHKKSTLLPRCFNVLVKGFEPPGFPRLILSQMRMPFRHTSAYKIL